MTEPREIRLEPFGPDDFERLISWIPSEEFLLQWGGPKWRWPLDREQMERHLAGTRGPAPGLYSFKAVDEAENRSVGHGEIWAVNTRHRSGVLCCILVGPPELRKQGIGGRIIDALLDKCFGQLGLHRVSLNAFDFNRAAISCYEKAGFTKEGLLRDVCRSGEHYWNSWLMSILEGERPPGRAAKGRGGRG